MFRLVQLFAIILCTAACAPATGKVAPRPAAAKGQRGIASWYGPEFKRTASGERYNAYSMTAAHRTLPFGTMVRVKHLGNQREVVLRINNRGPYSKGRIIDVSKAAAQKLGMIKSGIARVEVEVLPK